MDWGILIFQKKYQIHLSTVRKISISVTPDVVFFVIKNPSQVKFETYYFELILKKKYQPTLELIDDKGGLLNFSVKASNELIKNIS